ncbi:MAG: nitrophenyl compound nitroreductase subunit ArsF family protein [Nanoarchaeota archaeon]
MTKKQKKTKNNSLKKIALITIPIVILFIVLIVIATGENQIKDDENKESDLQNTYENISIEVYHFHATAQCYSCIAVGDLTEKTINTYFKEELETGQIKFAHINGELEKNRDLVLKYGATGSSIWIGTDLDGKFHKEENTRVWYKINNEADFMQYFKGVLEKRLKGDLS